MRTEAVQSNNRFTEEWEEWHRGLDASRCAPDAFLAYTGFNLLGHEPQQFEQIPGFWSSGPSGPTVKLDRGQSLTVDDQVVTGRHDFGPVAEREFRVAGCFGSTKIELSRRGGRDIMRALRPDTATRLNFRGTPTYPPDPAWAISGTFEPCDEVHQREIAASIQSITHLHDSPGRVVFERGGVEYALTILSADAIRNDVETIAVGALFRDATSGITTYAAGRYVTVEIPAEGNSEVVIDFNRARNLECAYIAFSPCALPPPENQLSFAIEAGEKTPLRSNLDNH
jgi:uncharacterized protein